MITQYMVDGYEHINSICNDNYIHLQVYTGSKQTFDTNSINIVV